MWHHSGYNASGLIKYNFLCFCQTGDGFIPNIWPVCNNMHVCVLYVIIK